MFILFYLKINNLLRGVRGQSAVATLYLHTGRSMQHENGKMKMKVKMKRKKTKKEV